MEQKYIDFTKAISYKRERKVYKNPITKNTEDTKNVLENLIATVPQLATVFNTCDDAKAFFHTYGIFSELKATDEEAFYQLKVGYYMDGVPTFVVYVLQKALQEAGSSAPNLALQSCYKLISKYDDYIFVNNEKEITLLDVIYFCFKKKFDLLTARRLISDDEVYIESVDRVAVLPDDILELIPDVSKLGYDPKIGIITEDGNPIRTLNARVGVTVDDFDLREAF